MCRNVFSDRRAICGLARVPRCGATDRDAVLAVGVARNHARHEAMTRWWWLGSAVDTAGLTAQIAELNAAGFGGVEVTVIYGAKGADSAYIPYLSPKWVEMIAHTATEAHRHGMGLDLPQGSGWRTGDHPSFPPTRTRRSSFAWIVRLQVRCGSRSHGPPRRRIVAVSDNGERIDISGWLACWSSALARARWQMEHLHRGDALLRRQREASGTGRRRPVHRSILGDRYGALPRDVR